MITLQSIIFDRTIDRTAAALPLATDSRSEPADLDWDRRGTLRRQAVAYPRTVNDVPLTITVGFDISTPLTREVLVRAQVQGAAPLGNVEPCRIPARSHGIVNLTGAVDASPLTDHVPARTKLRWIWEQSHDGGRTWREFDHSEHDIFVLLSEPKFPWGRPGNRARVAPWKDVIVTACELADGAATPDKIRHAITAGVHALGGKPVPDGSGGTNPIVWQSTSDYQTVDGLLAIFECSAFINLLRLERTERHLINCLDCASAIATFATALGVEMQLVTLAPGRSADTLVLNGVRLIGEPDDPPTTFHEHWVASLGPCDGFRVWDACLELDFDPGKPEDFHLSSGLPFDETGTDLTYRRRFLKTRQPRPMVSCVPPSYPDRPPANAVDTDNPIRKRRRAEFHGMMAGVRPTAPLIGVDAIALLRRIDGAQPNLLEQRQLKAAGTPYTQCRVPFTIVTDAGRHVLQLCIIATNRPEDALQAYLDLLIQYTTPLETRTGIGDFAFYSPADESIVVLRGTLVISLQNDARRGTSIGPAMRRVDSDIVRAIQFLLSSS